MAALTTGYAGSGSFLGKLLRLNWFMVLVITTLAGIGFAMLYSVSGGSYEPWVSSQMIRFAIGFALMLVVALLDLRLILNLALPAYLGVLLLLVLVEFIGSTGMGGQRWLDLAFFRLQPSELMKVGIILVLAAYYHALSQEKSERLRSLIVPALLIAMPAFLIIRQPDLGTTLVMILGAIAVLFLAGTRPWIFITGGVTGIASIPLLWGVLLRDYQKERVLTFLNPERDPLGSGYQILQSKIALGSGGLWGKGFMQGTQSQLNFLPEMKTDFIFTVLTEEFGLMGGLAVLMLYGILILYGLYVSLTCRNQFGRLLAAGLSFTIFLYIAINVSMVMGLMPVVGVPLPLISYGGSSIITVMGAFGLILAVALNRDRSLPRYQ